MYYLTCVRWAGLALLLTASLALEAQIVNIERQRIATDSAGWFGQASVSFSGAKNTKSLLALSTGTLLEYKSKSTKDLWLLITDLGLVSADEEKFANSGFGHLRYNRKLSGVIRWEIFTQVQYNSLTKIGKRVIGGTGPRIKLTQYEQAKFYLGIAYMYEYEESLDPLLYLRQHRMTSYFSFTLLPEETVSFSSTLYVQPLLKDPADYRIANETSLVLEITKKLNLNASFKYSYDAVPPAGVPKSTYSFANTLEVEF